MPRERDCVPGRQGCVVSGCRERPPAHHQDLITRQDQSTWPSTMTRSPFELRNRRPIIFWYAGDLYHPSAASRDGNSMMTRRGCGHSPSRIFRSPPRTTNLPPKASSVAGTAFRYSENVNSSVGVSAATTNAFIYRPPTDQFKPHRRRLRSQNYHRSDLRDLNIRQNAACGQINLTNCRVSRLLVSRSISKSIFLLSTFFDCIPSLPTAL